jgi:hypothetical protein
MDDSEEEVERIARELIARHDVRAPVVAAAQLNSCIDCHDWRGRDTWARIVRRIHELSAK